MHCAEYVEDAGPGAGATARRALTPGKEVAMPKAADHL